MRWITASAPCERSSPTRKYSKSYSDGTRKALAGLGRRIAYNRSFARPCRAYLPPPQGGAERYYDKTERYYDNTERYYDGGGTLLRQKFCSYPQIRLLRR